MPVRKDINVKIVGKDKLSPATKSASAGLNGLAKSVNALSSVALVALAVKAAQASAELVTLGAQSLATKERLIAFAGGVAEANGALEAIIAASDGTIDRMTATAMASRLLEQGLVSTNAEMGIAGAMVGRLGNQLWSTERRMQSLNMMLASQSKLRLDDFGLSVANVTARQKELVQQGYATEQAFKMAVFEEASEKLGIVGDVSGQVTVQIGQLNAAWTDLKLTMAEQLALLAEEADTLPTVTGKLRELADTVGKLGAMYGAVVAGRRAFLETGSDVAAQEAFNAVLAERVTLMAKETAELEVNTRATGANAQEVEKQVSLAKQLLSDRRAIYQQMERLHERHYEHLQDVAYRSAQAASRAYIDELGRAQEAALSILASEINARVWQSTLEGMYQQHLDNLSAIRDSYQETERQKEDDRYGEVRERLNEEQQARKKALDEQYGALLDNLDRERKAQLDALKQEYGKATTAEGRREELEEEHRRRLMGIYTASARKQEMKRHAAALKELEYEEAKAAIEEDYQERKKQAAKAHEAAQAALEKESQSKKEAAAARHEANLREIARRAQQAAIAREKRRYQDEVSAAQQRRSLQQQDEARRLSIIQQFEAQRQAERAVMQARERAHNAALEARREVAYQRQLDALIAALAKLTPLRVASYRKQQEAAERAIARAGEAKRAWAQWTMAPSPHPGGERHAKGGIASGGLALVGEEGPELLNLPAGTRVTPLTGGRLTPIVIHNHFGAGSVRSDRDIRRIAELQEKTLRLRGQGVVN